MKQVSITSETLKVNRVRGHSQLMSADISIFKIFLTPPPPQRKCPQQNVHSAINVRLLMSAKNVRSSQTRAINVRTF